VHVRGLTEPIRCTPEHPIWSRSQGRWVGAGELEVGEELAGLEGGEEPPSGGVDAAGTGAAAAVHAPALVVEQVVWSEAPAEVWNLEVHRAHTYRVGGAGVLVHNSDQGCLPDEVFSSKAPDQVTPGIDTLSGQHINDLGQVEPWTAKYDEFGRQVERTDGWTRGPHGDVHHHMREHGPGYGPKGRETTFSGSGPNTGG
jgi:hypothetical protein